MNNLLSNGSIRPLSVVIKVASMQDLKNNDWIILEP